MCPLVETATRPTQAYPATCTPCPPGLGVRLQPLLHCSWRTATARPFKNVFYGGYRRCRNRVSMRAVSVVCDRVLEGSEVFSEGGGGRAIWLGIWPVASRSRMTCRRRSEGQRNVVTVTADSSVGTVLGQVVASPPLDFLAWIPSWQWSKLPVEPTPCREHCSTLIYCI